MKIIYFTILLCLSYSLSFGQAGTKYKIDCDEHFEEDEDLHRPKPNNWFMAAADYPSPKEWKNQDTINLSAFNLDNLQNGMPILSFSPDQNDSLKGQIIFSSLIYYEHGEYGENRDSLYYTEYSIKNNKWILNDKLWHSKGKGRKYKFKLIWQGRNCAQLVRLNPKKRKQYPMKENNIKRTSNH